MAGTYRSRIAALQEALYDPACRSAAIETLRTLVDRVDLVPENGELAIVLRGDLAAMLSFAANKKPGTISGTGFSVLASQASLVAGARFTASALCACALTLRRVLRGLVRTVRSHHGPHLPINLRPPKVSSGGLKFIGCGGQI